VRFEFALCQDSMEFGAAQFAQPGMTGADALRSYVFL
jgi:hypothetical protein